MSQQYDNRGTGTLFNNSRKTSPKHPDFTGTYTDHDGNEYFLSGWKKTSKKGEGFMSIATTLKTQQPNRPATATAPAQASGINF